MAKPNWVTVSPQSSTGSGNVSVGVTDNPNQAERTGAITVTGSIGGRTITKTIDISQKWAATLRILFGASNPLTASHGSLTHQKANIGDTASIASSLVSAERLEVSYPWFGGSNILNYSCVKSGGVFSFELNKVHISAEDTVNNVTIDADYWDTANALFIAKDQYNDYEYTPVIRFTYNPTTDTLTIVDTLYSLGGVSFSSQLEGGDITDPVCPDWDKMLLTGRVGNEANGYGAMSMFWEYHPGSHEPIQERDWAFFHWYPKIVETTTPGTGDKEISVSIFARSFGAELGGGIKFLSTGRLSEYGWPPQGTYMQIILGNTQINVQYDQAPGQDMDVFYHQSIFVQN